MDERFHPWPPLSADRDGPTIRTLHLFSQIMGKVPTALLPWRNHGWQLTLHLHPRGLRTEPIHGRGGPFELSLDLIDGLFALEDGAGRRSLPLRPMSVADFHEAALAMLREAGHDVSIHPAPNEIDPALPFAEDREVRGYDPESARNLLEALLSADRVFRLFRSGFLGKVSPVHFFWGSFDLAVTRFSGRPAPPHPGGIPNLPDAVTREAYSHEVSSAGFWPGGGGAPGGPFFYSYAYPSPAGFAEAPVRPEAAGFDQALGEFVLDYETVRTAADPDAMLLEFLDDSYAAAADLSGWDRAALECERGRPAVPRPV
jgi:hypothetical protein